MGRIFSPSVLVLIVIIIIIVIVIPFLGKLIYPFHYHDEIVKAGETYSFEPHFIAALIYVESKFYKNAVSQRGARGLMQIMPQTALWITGELKWPDFHSDLLFDPVVNINLGTWYLGNLRQEFGDLNLVLAAYNAGRGNVLRWVDEGIWNGDLQDLDSVPFKETRDYIRKFWKIYTRYKILY